MNNLFGWFWHLKQTGGPQHQYAWLAICELTQRQAGLRPVGCQLTCSHQMYHVKDQHSEIYNLINYLKLT